MTKGGLPGYHAATMEALASMSEASLQAKIIEPLLRLMGFQHVRDMSGPDERGKDLVAVKLDFGRPKLYAIQIKKFKASGKHNKPAAMTHVVTQLRQAMLEPVLDPLTHAQRIPDRGVFITPYAIHRNALSSAIEQVRDLERREVTIIDGPILVDLVLSYMPEAVTDLDVQLRYRVHLAKAANLIPELGLLGMNESLSLDELFVEISVVHGKVLPSSSARHGVRGSRIISATTDELDPLRSFFTSWLKGHPRIWAPPKRKMTEEEELRHDGTRSELVEVDLDPLLEAMNSKLKLYSVELANAGRALDAKELNRVIVKGIELARTVNSLLQLKVVRENWSDLISSMRALNSHHETALIPATLVANIEHPVLVTGEPGGGKTTLLRRLSQIIARTSTSQLPLLIPLVRLERPSEEVLRREDPGKEEPGREDLVKGLIKECLFTLSNLGYEMDEKTFLAFADEGKFRLLLDGVDEAGSAASELFAAIQAFCNRHKRCLAIVTYRDTLTLEPWSDAVHLQLNSFTDVQLRSFVDRWFHAEPTARDKLNAWLNENPRMLMAARTPLITALLCSLQHVEADMPTTEVELYEERFGMLLGKWERAKGIEALSPRLRQRYWHFLMDLAIAMHNKQKRVIGYAEAIHHAHQLETNDFSAESIVMDCAYRGIFLRESTGNLSFGHLTYQEFLVARWLSRENPLRFILDRIGSSWWTKVLGFYAAIHGDISQLIQEALTYKSQDTFHVLLNLAPAAPLTRRSIISELRIRKEAWRSREP